MDATFDADFGSMANVRNDHREKISFTKNHERETNGRLFRGAQQRPAEKLL